MTDAAWTPPDTDEPVSTAAPAWTPPSSDVAVKQPGRIAKLGTAPAPKSKLASWYESFSQGLISPLEGAVQLGTHLVADIPGMLPVNSPAMRAYAQKRAADVDADLAQRRAKFEASRHEAGRDGFDVPELAGNILSPANFIPVGGAASRGATVAKGGLNALKGVLTRTAVRGGTGAAVGALQPITGGDYWDEKTKQAAVGLGAGVILPPAINGVIHGAGATVAPIVKWIARIKGPNIVQNAATQEIIRRMAQDAEGGGPTAQDMLDLLNTAPHKPLALTDVAGENVNALTGRLARQPGPARNTIADTLNERDLDAGLRLSDDVNKSIASGASHTASHALMDARAHAAAPLYKQAFEANQAIRSPAIDEILNTDAGKAAMNSAKTKMRNDRSLMGDNPPGAGRPNLRTLDYVKRSFDDMIGAARRTGAKDDARILTGLKSELVSEMDKADVTAAPGKPGLYAQARRAYSGPSQSLDAIETGEKMFTKPPEEIAAEVKDLSPSDKEFYKLGAAATIRKRILSTGMGGDESKKIIGNRYLQAQMRPLFDSDTAFKKFIDSVSAENKMFDTRFNALRGSQTATRAAEDQSPEAQAFGNAAHAALHLSTGNHLGAARKVWQAIGDYANRPNPEVANEMARLLTSPLNLQGSAGMQLLRDFARMAPKTANHLSGATRGAAMAGPSGAVAAQQLTNP